MPPSKWLGVSRRDVRDAAEDGDVSAMQELDERDEYARDEREADDDG